MVDPSLNAILVEKRPEGITTIAINRPHRRNAVNPATAEKLYHAFQDFDSDTTQLVCVFHSTYGNFCSGYDLQDFARESETKQHTEVIGSVQQTAQGPMGPSRLQLGKPVIAAVAGYAVAGGLELSLLADIRIVEEDATFGVFCRRFGVPLIDGGTVRLQAIIGLGRALDMILTGRPVSADEALAMGLANRVVPKNKSLEAALEMAGQLLRFPQKCMNIDRASCYYCTFEASSFRDALSHEFEHGQKITSTESVEGAKDFARGRGRHGRSRI